MKTVYINIIMAVAAMLLLGSCEKESVNEFTVTAPVIETFAPAEGYAGCEVSIEGSALNNVVGATIGGVDAEIVQRISCL